MPLKRRMLAVTRKLREIGSIGSALASTSHPYMAHIVPMRRCNLACTYCNEFDDVSDPVPIEEMVPPPANDKPAKKRRKQPLSTGLQAMARIERILLPLPDRTKSQILAWFQALKIEDLAPPADRAL